MSKKLYIFAAVLLIPALYLLLKENKPAVNNPETKPKAINTVQVMDKPAETKTGRSDYFKLHHESIVVDTHNDFIWQVFNKGADFGSLNPSTQSDLPKFKEGGLDVQVFAIWIPMSRVKSSHSFTLGQIDKLKSFAADYPEAIEYANTYEDIIRITNQSKICGLIGIEGATGVTDLDKVNEYFNLGVRYIGLTWNNSNGIASSARDEVERGKAGGLTDFGVEVVKRMDEVGMLIDVSHLGEQSFWDVTEISRNPIIASHSDCYTINPHYRNLTDEQIKAIAKSGGVIQVNFHDAFLQDKNTGSRVTIDKVLEHIDYIKALVGVDYIGIGSDYDGGITPPMELFDATKYPMLTKSMVEKGYTDEEIKKILGLNFLRVFKQVCG